MFERFTKAARATVERAADGRPGSDGRRDAARAPAGGPARADEDCLAVAGAGRPRRPAGRGASRASTGCGCRYVDGLDDDDAEALRAIGIDLDEVVRRIDRNLGGASPRRRRPPFSRGSKKALELALREAIALRHNYIGTEHLLLGLVRAGGPGRRRHVGGLRDRAGRPARGRRRRGPAGRRADGLNPVVRQAGDLHPARRTHLWTVLRQR